MQQTVMRDWKLPKSFLRLREPVDEIVFEEIGRARRDPSLGEREDVVAKLVQSRSDRGEPLTDREIRDHLVTLTFQGHRSTANALAWTLERLTRHPESLEKAEAEAQTDNEDYLDAVVKEALRVRPPFPFVMRTLQAPLPLAEYELAAGMTIALNAYILHRREDEYPEPERFRPERFLERPPRPYHWIPFGGDPRACVGAGFALFEMKIALHRLLQRFRLATTTEPDEKVKKLGVQFSPSRGGRVVLLERS
jgi:cytochrome P450